jgi:hypothetical protein
VFVSEDKECGILLSNSYIIKIAVFIPRFPSPEKFYILYFSGDGI